MLDMKLQELTDDKNQFEGCSMITNPSKHHADISQTAEMYATQERLNVRSRTHEIYTQPKMDFPEWVLNHILWQGDEKVLDIGCGAGLYMDTVRSRLNENGLLIAADISTSMLRTMNTSKLPCMAFLLNADATYLPIRSQSFDVVMANHMLYYVQEVKKTVWEFRRVLRDGGYFIATTNSQNSMRDFHLEIVESLSILGYEDHPPSPSRARFTLENGADYIKSIFPSVQTKQVENALIFPNVKPVEAYIDSLRPTYEPYLHPDLSWETLMEQIRKRVSEKIQINGKYKVSKTTGVFIAK
jgi:ubiquinone/menaquinone biosynthesis C-methylase UbiE